MLTFSILSLCTLFQAQSDPSQARSLVETLRSDKVEEREEATQKLKGLGKAAIPELERASIDKDAEVASRAKWLIRVIRTAEKLPASLKKALPNVEDRLASDDPHAWTEAFLAAAADRDAKGLQAALLPDDLEILAGPALRGAREEGEKLDVIDVVERNYLLSAAPEIFRLLRDKEHQVVWRAENALVNLDARQMVPDILRLLDDPSQPIRHTGIGLLRNLGTREAIPGIIRRLKDSNGEIRNRAAEAIAELEAREAAPELLEALEDPEANKRGEVAEALGRIGAKEAIPPLIKLLKADDPRVRRSAAEALARLEAKGAIADLVRVLKDSDTHVQIGAMHALSELGAKEAVPGIMKLLDAKDQHVRSWVAYRIADLDAREEIPTLVRLLEDSNESVRTSAAWALGKMGVTDVIPALVKMLSDSDANARSNAAYALARMGARERIPEIAKLLGDTTPWVRGRALAALLKLGAENTLDEALKLLKDPEEGVRGDALSTIGCLGGQADGQKILPILADPSPMVRIDAAAALCFMGLKDGIPVLLREARDRRWPVRTADGGSTYVGRSFRALNAARQRAAWNRLCNTPAPADLEGTRKEALEGLAKAAGLAVEWPSSMGQDPWLSGQRSGRRRANGERVLDQLLPILQGYRTTNKPARYEFILEEDRLLVMTYYDALRFWERWWANETRK